VGAPTVAAIVAQKFVPGVLDRYLGRTGYDSQQIKGEPRDPNAPDDLYHYVPGVHGAHGKFDARSKRTSAEVFVSLHRTWLLAAAVLVLAAGGTLLAKKSL
jgi:hypothetical protein